MPGIFWGFEFDPVVIANQNPRSGDPIATLRPPNIQAIRAIIARRLLRRCLSKKKTAKKSGFVHSNAVAASMGEKLIDHHGISDSTLCTLPLTAGFGVAYPPVCLADFIYIVFCLSIGVGMQSQVATRGGLVWHRNQYDFWSPQMTSKNSRFSGQQKHMDIQLLKQNKILKSIALRKKHLKMSTAAVAYAEAHIWKSKQNLDLRPHPACQSPGWHETFLALGISN